MPLIFIAAYIFVGISISINTPQFAIIGLGVLAVFIGIYFLSRSLSKPHPKL
jgi:APA family basic amino acid/polyamine antiporter